MVTIKLSVWDRRQLIRKEFNATLKGRESVMANRGKDMHHTVISNILHKSAHVYCLHLRVARRKAFLKNVCLVDVDEVEIELLQ